MHNKWLSRRQAKEARATTHRSWSWLSVPSGLDLDVGGARVWFLDADAASATRRRAFERHV